MATALHRLKGDSEDLVVVLADNRLVLGAARKSVLTQADPASIVAQVMKVGPTTIRPDEDLDAVRGRMSKRGVRSLIVTQPTGQLLGLLATTESHDDE